MAQKWRKNAKFCAKKMSKSFQKVDQKNSKKFKKNSSRRNHEGNQKVITKKRSFIEISVFFENPKK